MNPEEILGFFVLNAGMEVLVAAPVVFTEPVKVGAQVVVPVTLAEGDD